MTDNGPRYSIEEIERRWLVDAAAVGDLSQARFRRHEDLYLADSRLRLRKIIEADGTTTYKLGKKYGKRTPLSEPITNLYLEEGEYRMLRLNDGRSCTKRRYAWAGGSLDCYEQPNAGLMVFELEFDSEQAASIYSPPGFVTREITDDPAYSGFELARPLP